MKSIFSVKTIAALFAIVIMTAFVPVNHSSEQTTFLNGSPVVFTQVVHMTADEETLPVDSDAKGIAILRLTADMTLYSKVIVNRLETDDGMLTAAHIHTGAPGETGPPIIFLAHDESEFGQTMVQQLTPELYDAVLNDALYVNAHTTVYPAGIVRGQIR